MSINIVAMVNQSAMAQRTKIKSDSCPLPVSNSTHIGNANYENEDGEFLWSPELQGYILGSYNLGYVLSQIPIGRLVDTYGCKWFLVMSSLVTAVSTFLMPVFAWINAEALTALQLIRGVSQGVLPPAANVLVCNWFTRSERGQMLGFMKSGSSMGCIVASLLSGFLCASSLKWPSSFYTTGAMAAVVSILLISFVHETPEVHPRISEAELNFILKDQTKKQKKNGMFTSLTFLLQFVCAQLTTYLSSLMINKKIASITFTRKFWNFVSCFGFSTCLLGIYLAGCNRYLSAIFGILSTGFTGSGFSGSFVSVPEMAPTFAGVLKGISVTISCTAMVVLPLTVGFLTDGKQTIEQWNKVFFIGIGVVMSSGIVYCIFGSADVQPWNFVEEEKVKEDAEPKTRF